MENSPYFHGKPNLLGNLATFGFIHPVEFTHFLPESRHGKVADAAAEAAGIHAMRAAVEADLTLEQVVGAVG